MRSLWPVTVLVTPNSLGEASWDTVLHGLRIRIIKRIVMCTVHYSTVQYCTVQQTYLHVLEGENGKRLSTGLVHHLVCVLVGGG